MARICRLLVQHEKKSPKPLVLDEKKERILLVQKEKIVYPLEGDPMPPSRSELAEIVQEALAFDIPDVSPREDVIESLPEPKPFNLVHIITGIRRCGKTFYAFQWIKRLLNQGVPRERIFYFNFSDDRLLPAGPSLMSDVVEEYWRQVPQARAEGCYLFLDEVQEAGAWQGVCQRLAEHERVTLVITGSSSKLSADQIATEFRGRSQEHPMHPLSFREFCAYHGIETPQRDDLRKTAAVSPAMRTNLESAYDRYLVAGGFPGVQSLGEGSRIQMLQAYHRDVVARDVVERSSRTDISLANQVGLFCLRNTACELSVNNLVESLKAVGYRTSWEKVSEVVRLFEQAHLIGILREFAVSLAPQAAASDKVYGIDQGMVYATSRANQQDIGKRLETAVYMELMRRTSNGRMEAVTSYTAPTSKRQKVDFLVGDALAEQPYELLQVTVDMTAEKTRQREVGSLEAAMEKTGVVHGTIITLREEGQVETDRGSIEVVPAWRWALS